MPRNGERTGQLDLRGLEWAARSKANACSTLGVVIAEARERSCCIENLTSQRPDDDSCENPWRTGLRSIQI